MKCEDKKKERVKDGRERERDGKSENRGTGLRNNE